jgi:hypothetical protein
MLFFLIKKQELLLYSRHQILKNPLEQPQLAAQYFSGTMLNQWN